MKDKILICIVSFFLVAFLLFGAQLILQDRNVKKTEMSPMSSEQLFVDIKADTLIRYLDLYFRTENHPSLKIEDKSRELTIEYNQNSPILLNIIDNGMADERKELEKSGIIIDDGQKTKIVLNKHKLNGVQFVKCPSPILSEILRIKTQQ